jgi:hypothetical protein
MMRNHTLGMIVAAGALAAMAGLATSQPQPASPAAATQVDLARSQTDNAALGQARQDPLAARLRGVLGQDPATAAVLQAAVASSVPVLGPADPALLRTARIYTGDRHYMLVVQRGDQIIEIYGSTKAFQSPTTPPVEPPTQGRRPGLTAVAPAALPVPGLVQQVPGAAPPTTTRQPTTAARQATAVRTSNLAAARARTAAAAAAVQTPTPLGLTNLRTERTEYGIDITFSRFGAAYNVSFLCAGPGVAGCTEPDAILFALTLQLIGGGAS